jgi:acyl carrier protein
VSRADEVRDAVAAHLGVDAVVLTPEASLAADLRLDSLAGMELATHLEDRFRLRITDEELATLRTYGDVERLIVRKVAS